MIGVHRPGRHPPAFACFRLRRSDFGVLAINAGRRSLFGVFNVLLGVEAAVAVFVEDAEGPDLILGEMVAEVGQDDAGMYRKRAPALLRSARIESERKERVRRLRLAVGLLFLIGTGMVIVVLEVERGYVVPARGDGDDARVTGLGERRP